MDSTLNRLDRLPKLIRRLLLAPLMPLFVVGLVIGYCWLFLRYLPSQLD